MIRLQRIGRRNDPSFRVVVNEKAAGPKTGRYIEELGHYDPRLEKGKDLQMKTDRVKYWLSVGAQPSGTFHNLLIREGILSGKKRDVRPFKVIKKVQPEAVPEPIKEVPQEVASSQ